MTPGSRSSSSSPQAQRSAPARRTSTARIDSPRVRRFVDRHRRSITVGLATISVLAAIQALRAPVSETSDVLVASHNLAGGLTLRTEDVEHRAVATADVPPNAIADASTLVNHVLTASIEAGEVFTRTRVLTPSGFSTAGRSGMVSTPVRVADSGAVALLEPGDHVDILATNSSLEDGSSASSSARLVASDATVVAIPHPRSDTTRGPFAASDSYAASGMAGALLVISTTLDSARTLAAAGSRGQISIVIRPR